MPVRWQIRVPHTCQSAALPRGNLKCESRVHDSWVRLFFRTAGGNERLNRGLLKVLVSPHCDYILAHSPTQTPTHHKYLLSLHDAFGIRILAVSFRGLGRQTRGSNLKHLTLFFSLFPHIKCRWTDRSRSCGKKASYLFMHQADHYEFVSTSDTHPALMQTTEGVVWT